MQLLDRNEAVRLGRDTVRILASGGYDAPSGRRIDLREAVTGAVRGTVEYGPDRPAPVRLRPIVGRMRTAVQNETVLAVGRRMAAGGPIAALNFASAETPGGGFLSGARAQEESIARSSALHTVLEPCAMYTFSPRQAGRNVYRLRHLLARCPRLQNGRW